MLHNNHSRCWIAFGWLVSSAVAGLWAGNLDKLSYCDGEAPYTCEVTHGLGLFPLLSAATVWYGTDKEMK